MAMFEGPAKFPIQDLLKILEGNKHGLDREDAEDIYQHARSGGIVDPAVALTEWCAMDHGGKCPH